ncbi:MAG TPA: hypothetical protein VKY19_17350 [Ktedonosporobacter sp.]|nr:hypothetical protein [Ktedonosporobacter sp.]
MSMPFTEIEQRALNALDEAGLLNTLRELLRNPCPGWCADFYLADRWQIGACQHASGRSQCD